MTDRGNHATRLSATKTFGRRLRFGCFAKTDRPKSTDPLRTSELGRSSGAKSFRSRLAASTAYFLAELTPWFRTSKRSGYCLTSKMSHGYGWRGSCAAGDVTDMAVGSGAL